MYVTWYIDLDARAHSDTYGRCVDGTRENITQVFFLVFRQIRYIHLSSSYASYNKYTLIYHYYLSITMFLQMCVFFFVFVLLLLVVTMDLMKKKQIRDEPSSLRSEFGKNLIYRPFLSFSLSISRHQPVCECITHLRQIKFEPTDQTTNAHQIASHTALINYVIHSIKIYIIYNKVLISCRHFQCVEFFRVKRYNFLVSSNHTLFRCLSKSNLATALFNRFQHQSKISSYYLLYEAVNEKKSAEN